METAVASDKTYGGRLCYKRKVERVRPQKHYAITRERMGLKVRKGTRPALDNSMKVGHKGGGKMKRSHGFAAQRIGSRRGDGSTRKLITPMLPNGFSTADVTVLRDQRE